MTNTYKAVFIPNNDVVLNLYKGYVLNGEQLVNIKDSDVYTETKHTKIDDSFSKPEMFLIIIFVTPFIPIFIIAVLISSIFKKDEIFGNRCYSILHSILSSIFKKDMITRTSQIKNKIYEDAVKEDIPEFLDLCKKNFVKVFIYSYQSLSLEQTNKQDVLKQNGNIESLHFISKLSDLSSLIKLENISILNSILIISDTSEIKEAELLGFYSGNGYKRNVGLWQKQKIVSRTPYKELEIYSSETLIAKKKAINHYLKAESSAFFTNDIILFIEDASDLFLNDYIKNNLNKINEKLIEKGFQLLYFPSFKSSTLKTQASILDFVRYRIPVLYSLSDNELEEIITSILLNNSPIEFYRLVLEELKLPFFKKPSLLRNISGGFEYTKNRFTYKPIEYKTKSDLDNFFDWYIEQLKIPNDSENVYFSLAKDPTVYDADWHFGVDSKKDTDEIKQKIDSIKAEGKFGVLAEAIMYMLESIKDEKPEILNKIRPLIEKNNMLESKVVLSPISIDKHYNIFLTDFGNKEVKMHALPKTVYILFLRHRNGIKFKELYEHKKELLEIYYKISNKDNKEEIEKAINDLVDMTNPSINQKCSRIREAFRNIMDEQIAKHYYIDGANGEPKKIMLPENLIDIRF